ncbi:type II secretion system protein [Paenibacillus sp. 22594]|uniref:type II secretion system protein n=1 Tax=Paenibacillus sp. 22594 TaxID=3453947 RepID=UPI003F86CF0F
MLAQAIKRRLSKEENQKGFTLIELLAVIVILGIIAVIAIPMIGGIINNTRDDADAATARQIYDAARLYITSEKDGIFDPNPTTANDTVTVYIKNTATASLGLIDKHYLETDLVLPSNKETITGGSVVFIDGKLKDTGAVLIETKTYTNAKPKTFTAKEVLNAEKE